jgi:hypothetical protein
LLLGAGSLASLAANVAVAEPALTSRIIAAWPSFALIGSYELLMRQVRATAAQVSPDQRPARSSTRQATGAAPAAGRSNSAAPNSPSGWRTEDGSCLQREALLWARKNRAEDGSLPSGRAIGAQFGRHERWGRLVKQHGEVLGSDAEDGEVAA